ncbi:MAG: tRNA (adenosine(37)-N6)-threonylcarbamoyltransferase complex transferase subunit TsaD [Candidatus Gracilibacteria bacterium]|jgi:N6-L-threonylcarbamoyladenine synthase
MIILGIETSCDETAAAVVENGTIVHSNVIASQIALHQITGGVVPEVAAREHVLKIIPVIEEALKIAGVSLKKAGKSQKRGGKSGKNFGLQDLDAIAVTRGPGLLSSLIIGVSAASTLAMVSGKPLIPVNHIAGHIYANWLGEKANDPVQFPLVTLTVSGGHNELVYMKDHVHFELLGETLDDAAGEAFDKVARLLGLGYPGGPAISKTAENGDAQRFKLPRAYINENSYDFSFSGLKTAVLNLVKAEYARELADSSQKSSSQNGGANANKFSLSPQFIADCAASFQEAVCEILSDKLLRAAQEYSAKAGYAVVKEIHLAGGVSANRRLRAMVAEKIEQGYFCDHKGRKVAFGYNLEKAMAGQAKSGKVSNALPRTFKPKLRYAENITYCTDNAAMIAATAYFHFKKAPKQYIKLGAALLNDAASGKPVLADPNFSLFG